MVLKRGNKLRNLVAKRREKNWLSTPSHQSRTSKYSFSGVARLAALILSSTHFLFLHPLVLALKEDKSVGF